MGRNRWSTAAAVAMCAAVAVAGCAAHRGADAPAGGAKGADGAKAEARRDEQGRGYTVRTISKRQAKRIDATHARTNWGIVLDLVGEDESDYHYKLYDVSAYSPVPAATPDAAAHKRVAASYVSAIRGSDRLRFTPFGNGLPAQGQWRDGFDLADVDGDGKLDIVHGPPRTGQPVPRVFRGDGRGNWRLWREAKYPPLPIDYGDAAAADLDADGHVDLVLSSHLRGFAAVRGDGHGGFTSMSRGLDLVAPGSGAPAPFSSRAFRLVDWNADGRLDILALGEGPRLDMRRGGGDKRGMAGAAMGVALFLNQGKDGWRRADARDPQDGIFGQAVAVGDFDADGRRDFATGSGILGRNDLVYLGTSGGGWRRIAVPALRPAAYVRSVASADFDGDGRDDLAVVYTSYELETWRAGVDVLLARVGDTFERRTLASIEDKSGPFALATGDLDGDRNRDVVALTTDGETMVFLGDGRGGFTREKNPPPAWEGRCRGVHAALRDLDGDGRDELVAAFAEESSDTTGEARCPHGGGMTAWKPDVR